MRKTQRFFFYIFTIAFVFSCIEMASFFVVTLLAGKGIFYRPAIYNSYEDYLSTRDEVLGWPSPKLIAENDIFDSNGSRVIPAFPDPTEDKTCISLYGDSFTQGAEVDNKSAWSNILSILVGCRVANYGVGGYGSDQAYLRFEGNTGDSSRIVFLNHLSENILRNVNQFRDLLYPGAGIGFKPRFIIDGNGSLKFVPLPTFTAERYKDVALRPAQYLSNEYFIPDGPSGVTVAGFPYTFSVLKAFKHFQVKAKFRNEPWFHEFYKREHPSKGLDVTAKILASFHEKAIERDKVPVVTIIPTAPDLVYFLENGVWTYQSLINELSLSGISVFNYGQGIVNHINNRDPCVIFDDWCAHYNEEGNEILARLAFRHLQKRGLMQEIDAQKAPVSAD